MSDQLAGIHLVAGRRVPIPQSRRAAIPVRLLARVRSMSLDQALADGADPTGSALLAQRSAWLTSKRTRRNLARFIRRLLERKAPRRGPSAAVVPNRFELAAASQPLTWIAALLESGEPVYAQGVARLNLLLTLGGSPLYDPDRIGQLMHEVEAILGAMEGREENW